MWGPRAGGKRGKTQRRGQGRREQSPRPLGPARAGVSIATVPSAGQVSVITGTRTCWSQHCHCSPHGTGQRDHRAPGGPPAPRHGDGRETPQCPHLHPPTPIPNAGLGGGGGLGLTGRCGWDSGGAERVQGGIRVGWGGGTRVKEGRRSPRSCLPRDEGQAVGPPGQPQGRKG